MSAAAIEANVAEIRERLAVWARHMAARYNGPVYLLGSTLHHPTPRDTDIRIVVDDHEFAARYRVPLHRLDPLPEHHPVKRRRPELIAGNYCDFANDGPSQRWVDDVAKFNATMSKRLGRNMDIQVVPESWWHPGIYPDPIILAAPTSRLFIYNAHVADPAAHASGDQPHE